MMRELKSGRIVLPNLPSHPTPAPAPWDSGWAGIRPLVSFHMDLALPDAAAASACASGHNLIPC